MTSNNIDWLQEPLRVIFETQSCIFLEYDGTAELVYNQFDVIKFLLDRFN